MTVVVEQGVRWLATVPAVLMFRRDCAAAAVAAVATTATAAAAATAAFVAAAAVTATGAGKDVIRPTVMQDWRFCYCCRVERGTTKSTRLLVATIDD